MDGASPSKREASAVRVPAAGRNRAGGAAVPQPDRDLSSGRQARRLGIPKPARRQRHVGRTDRRRGSPTAAKPAGVHRTAVGGHGHRRRKCGVGAQKEFGVTQTVSYSIAIVMTIMVLSRIVGSNPVFRVAQYLFVGVSLGLAFV